MYNVLGPWTARSPDPEPPTQTMEPQGPPKVSITSLLKRLWPDHAKENVTAAEIAEALSHIFTDSLSSVQTGALLTALHFTGLDRDPTVLALCAQAMRDAAAKIDHAKLMAVVETRGKKEGAYNGGLVCVFDHRLEAI
jgi:anthranilate phosphoribosyltransferase